MKRKVPWLILGVVVTLCMIFTACPAETTRSTTPTPKGGANWWGEYGEPEYGGEIVFRTGQLDAISFDPKTPMWGHTLYFCEALFGPDWTLDRSIWPYNMGFTPEEYYAGWLAESWDWTGPQTVTVKLRENVTFQDKAPVNGRGLTAQDIQYSYDRQLGTGSGFTEPNMFIAGNMPNVERVVAVDDYTIEFQLNTSGVMTMYQILTTSVNCPAIAREWIEQGDTDNWENAVGTGPWLLTEYDRGVSITYSRDPNYWGIDPRYPDKEIPYLDTVKEVAVADLSTAVAALRSGKIDMIVDPRGGLSLQQAQTIAKSDPDIQLGYLPSVGANLDIRCDREPFTDIRVRKALNMALDREVIAETFYGGLVEGRACGVAAPAAYESEGWITAYEDWPAELKAEYSYDPEGARQLLAEAGYPNGFDTNVIASTSGDLQLLQAIKAYFLDIGVDMEIQTLDMATYMQYGAALKHDQLVYNANTAMMFPPPQNIAFRASYSTRDNWTQNNDAHYDDLVLQFLNATSVAEAKEKFKEADLYLLKQHWSVQVCPTVAPMAWQPYIKGYMGELMGSAEQRGYYGARMWVDSELKESMR